MDNEKIKALAREYWNSKSPANMLKDYPEAKPIAEVMQKALSSYMEDAIEDHVEFLQWVLESHCIVEKEKIRAAHECEVVNWYEEQNTHLRDEFLHGRRLLESLFGSELFNESEK